MGCSTKIRLNSYPGATSTEFDWNFSGHTFGFFDCGYIDKEGVTIMNSKVFWIFGILQSLSLGIIVFLIFRSLNAIEDTMVIGLDTRLLLSISFPLFLLLVEYAVFAKK